MKKFGLVIFFKVLIIRRMWPVVLETQEGGLGMGKKTLALPWSIFVNCP